MSTGQKNELLRKSLQQMMLREHKKGLSAQDKYLKNKLLREMFGAGHTHSDKN